MKYIHGKSLIRIAITDDHIMVMEALSRLINTFENCKVILEAGNGKQLIEKMDPQNLPELVIIDLAMPGINGLDTIGILKKQYPAIKFLAISMYPPEHMILRTLKSGGHGFLGKNMDKDILKYAIYEIMLSGFYFSDQATARVAYELLENKNYSIHHQFSDEQTLFLKLLVSGKPYKALAGIMHVSERHIEYLRKNLFEYFEVQSRTELTVKAIKWGLPYEIQRLE